MTISTLPASIAAFHVDASRADCPRGFVASGLACGLRKSGKPDLALFLAPAGASVAGVFTKNLLCAAPVTLSKRHLEASAGVGRAVLINSGCANAATGAEGDRSAADMAAIAAAAIGCAPEETLIASTGVIGPQLEVGKIRAAMPALADEASPNGLDRAADAILTTDTCPKAAQAHVTVDGRTFHVAGVAKGSGMIHPNMATMLGVVMTDAAVAPEALQRMLTVATNRTFNRVSVDGDTSTNDCVYAMASGEAGDFPEQVVADAIERVCRELALKIVRDGEGAKKVIHVSVSDALTEDEAEQVARTVGSSLLVRTAIAGGDPNWGRIAAAVGRSGAPLDMNQVVIRVGGLSIFADGAPTGVARERLAPAFAGPDVHIDISLGRGQADATYLTCDLTEGYIQINAYYTT
ncbi:MAG: bifunctional glutamate N-acetyltransferase/amino-acid acetyltransferase ArgJ [Phycisphaerales bacterium]|nr:bifunctional glutamate N-acetyltransferase/amino-acid acetyltransferase ArgJ [Phycisphaerales bacterium]